jgi:hypothetical protein
MGETDTESSKGILTHSAAIQRVQEVKVVFEDRQSNASTGNGIEAQLTMKTAT